MAKASKNLEPQQVRSRESLRKLLKAAAEVLGQRGLEGTTIPRIAEHAGLTPGAVYRRFRDKDALLETVILGILERQDERLKSGLTPEAAGQIPLPVFAEQIIGGMVLSYKVNASLLINLKLFAKTRRNTPFWYQVIRLETRSYQRVIDLFLAHRKEIRHPDPRTAISLGLMTIVSTLHELMDLPQDHAAWKGLLPKTDAELTRELVRLFLSYLGVLPAGVRKAARRAGTIK
jgi:AcrR family transcriptional regulator